ncbi:MAG: Hint domain-containing protein [Pseudomonadota bacterium]
MPFGTGTYVISWSQTETDGLPAAPVSALEVGSVWRWDGVATRVDGPDDILLLGPTAQSTDIRTRAARTVRRAIAASVPSGRARDYGAMAEPDFDRSFTVTDGHVAYTLTLIDVPELARPLVLMEGRVPPSGREYWVVRALEMPRPVNRVTEMPVGVICFTAGTRLRTPEGDVPVEHLSEGDQIDTKDSGPQQIVWIGKRRMSGARLHAMPELRPIRIRAGALGDGVPPGDLLVSPRHRMLIEGPVADALFNTPEVLVAAEDLVNDRTVFRDHTVRSVEYVHLLLPRHHVVWANGLETESFHPASTAFETIEPAQRRRLSSIVPGIEADPFAYGAAARRELTRSEAALLAHDGIVRV